MMVRPIRIYENNGLVFHSVPPTAKEILLIKRRSWLVIAEWPKPDYFFEAVQGLSHGTYQIYEAVLSEI